MGSEGLRNYLEWAYRMYNRRELIPPDPLECVLEYSSRECREIVGLIAACVAFGGVKQIIGSLRRVLCEMPDPCDAVMHWPEARLRRRFQGWRHRFVSGEDLVRLLDGIRNVLKEDGSLESCFAGGIGETDEDVLPALEKFVSKLRAPHEGVRNYLLPSPADGSACKRMNLYLRWMARHDDVDPGVWTSVRPSKLIVPLDTHMHRVALNLDLTKRRQADLKTAVEITRQFRLVSPEDPVRYDFALTRPGIRGER